MGYSHHAKYFHFQSCGSGDIGLNNLGRGPPEMVKVMMAFNIFWQLHFQQISLSRY